MPPRAGVKPTLTWRHDAVLRVLLQSYCLEPRFECWEALQVKATLRPFWSLQLGPSTDAASRNQPLTDRLVVLAAVNWQAACAAGRAFRVLGHMAHRRWRRAAATLCLWVPQPVGQRLRKWERAQSWQDQAGPHRVNRFGRVDYMERRK